MNRPALYRHFDRDGALLYVGISCDFESRTRAHERGSEWFGAVARTDVEWCLSRGHALALEAVAIQFEKPLHNIKHSRRASEVTPEHGQLVARAADLDTKEALKAAKISQRALAEKVGISTGHMSRIAKGNRTPGLELACALEVATNGVLSVHRWFPATPSRPSVMGGGHG